MNGFELQEWHIVVLLFTIVAGILKSDITSAIKSSIVIKEQKGNVGKKVLMLAPTGDWLETTILGYQHEIPFIRGGGVTVEHHDDEKGYIQEKLSFTNWGAQRLRTA